MAWLWQFARFLAWKLTHPRHWWQTTEFGFHRLKQRCRHPWCAAWRARNFIRDETNRHALWIHDSWTIGGPGVKGEVLDPHTRREVDEFLESLK